MSALPCQFCGEPATMCYRGRAWRETDRHGMLQHHSASDVYACSKHDREIRDGTRPFPANRSGFAVKVAAG